MRKKIDLIKERFEKTMDLVSEFLKKPISEIKRDEYVRVCVDNKVHGRLNKEELNIIGGFRVAKDRLYDEEYRPKVLIFDIETAPLLGYVWGLWDNNLGLNMIKEDWYVLSWSAKWLGSPESEVMYQDQRDKDNIEDDSEILKSIWNLLDESDIVITQNGIKFDVKKLNARFILNGMQPPSSFRHIDTLRIAKKHFAFTSNKLEYMTNKLCTKYKKLKHGGFSGFELWKQCMKGNIEAWESMEKYNRYDVLSLEELYYKLIPWDNTIDFNAYYDEYEDRCTCGCKTFSDAGFHYTNLSKFKKYKCDNCGKEFRDSQNLLSKSKRKNLRRRTLR